MGKLWTASQWVRKSAHCKALADFCESHGLRYTVEPPGSKGHPFFCVTVNGRRVRQSFPGSPGDNSHRASLNAVRDLKRTLREQCNWALPAGLEEESTDMETTAHSLEQLGDLVSAPKPDPRLRDPAFHEVNDIIIHKATGLPAKNQPKLNYMPTPNGNSTRVSAGANATDPNTPAGLYAHLRRSYIEKRAEQGADHHVIAEEISEISDPIGPSRVHELIQAMKKKDDQPQAHLTEATFMIDGVIVDRATNLPLANQPKLNYREWKGRKHAATGGSESALKMYRQLRREYLIKRTKEGAVPAQIAEEISAISDPVEASAAYSAILQARKDGDLPMTDNLKTRVEKQRPQPFIKTIHTAPKPHSTDSSDATALNDLIDERIASAGSTEEALARAYAIFTRITLAVGKLQTADAMARTEAALAQAQESEKQLAEIRRMLRA